MKGNRAFARFFAPAALLGVTTLFAGTALHPMGADPNDAAAAFAEYALDQHWVWSHLAQFVGVVLLTLALIGFAAELDQGLSALWARIGVALAIGLIAIAAALQAVDGVAVKRMVDRWAAAGTEHKPYVFEAAFAVRQIEIGLAGFLSFVTGLTIAAFGLALYFNPTHAKWFAWAAIANGVLFVASGVAQQTTGFFQPVYDLEYDGEHCVHGLDSRARGVRVAKMIEGPIKQVRSPDQAPRHPQSAAAS
jgi:hypothetical protein